MPGWALASVALGLALTGCSSSNIPVSYRFPATNDRPAQAHVFLDANGTFYPDRWQNLFSPSRIDKQGSLLNGASSEERRWIEAEENRQLDALSATLAGKVRVFILVHGYNIDEADAGLAFDLVERRIAFSPDDAVIRLHWDGMLGSGVGMGAIWFPATGYSQVVGLRGLRRILELPQDQDVYLISHSRGASVILSALGDPPFAPRFRAETERLRLGFGLLAAPALSDRGNRIRAIFLGPAVGYPDFWDPSCEPGRVDSMRCSDPPVQPAESGRRCPQYRVFTSQLKAIRYTINKGDTTLQKKVLNLRRYFNATDLGFDEAVGRRLAACYSFEMDGHPVRETHPHAFTLYAQDPELADMLRASGVQAE